MKKLSQTSEPSIMERFLSYGAERAPNLFRRLGPAARTTLGDQLQRFLQERQKSMQLARMEEAAKSAVRPAPLTDEELFDKFAEWSSPTVDPGKAERIWSTLKGLDDLGDISELMRLL